jgi:hypothetical protein
MTEPCDICDREAHVGTCPRCELSLCRQCTERHQKHCVPIQGVTEKRWPYLCQLRELLGFPRERRG